MQSEPAHNIKPSDADNGDVGPFLLKTVAAGILVGLVSYILFSHSDFMEHWHYIADKYEYLELDEAPFIFAFVSVYLVFFLWLALVRQRKILRTLENEITVWQEAQSRLSEALIAHERFFTMSHDFRAPVNSIPGLTYLMRTDAFGPLENEKYQEYVEDIHRSATMLDMTIAQVLDVSALAAD
ncbi:MAG: histidine kinase dimerization/phospho-acceptor domain-containing protein [Rhodospirillaceae bacterium]